MTSSPKVWGDALRLLQDEIPDFAFEAWIAPLAVKLSDARVVIGCPTSFHRERVRIHFSTAIQRCWNTAWDASPISSACDDDRVRPPIAIVDMHEFATSDGHHIELRLPAKRAEPVANRAEQIALASGAAPEIRSASQPAPHVAAPIAAPTMAPIAGANATTASLQNDRGDGMTSAGAAGAASTADAESATVALRAVPVRAPRAARPALNPRDVLQIEERARLELDGEPAQGELPFSFESFVVGPCNALAREAALALARRRQSSLNQLYLGGESGMGKTHLARAAAAEARRQGLAVAATGRFGGPGAPGAFAGSPSTASPGLALGAGAARANAFAQAGARGPGGGARNGVVYTTAEQFTSEFVSAVRNGRSEEFQKRYRAPIGLLIVEDVQFFDGRMKTQLELFHTVQHVLDAGGRVLFTGDRAPRNLTGLSERMRTQLARGFVAELEQPDAIVRRHILRSKAAAGGVHLPVDCLDLLVESTGGSVRDIESVLIQVVTTSSLLGRPIDLALTRDAIDRKAGVGSPLAPRRVATNEIVRIVAAFFGKRPESLAARSRRRDVLVPRQLAMYLAHRYTDASFTEIGRGLGRDHPSVRNAITRVERLVLENAPLRYQVEALSERIDQTLANRRPGKSDRPPADADRVEGDA